MTSDRFSKLWRLIDSLKRFDVSRIWRRKSLRSTNVTAVTDQNHALTSDASRQEATTPSPTDILAHFDAIEGMMTRLSAASLLFLLYEQAQHSILGHLVEFGVYKGKSASILCHYWRPGERIILVDQNYRKDSEHLKTTANSLEFYKRKSEEFFDYVKNRADLEGKVRFMHIDGNHTYMNVQNDLSIANILLSLSGIIAVDDFLNPHYPQVQAATYDFLAHNRNVKLFLSGAGKAFLCRQKYHSLYSDLVLDRMITYLGDLGFPIRLSKTDTYPSVDMFHFQERNPNESVFYGKRLYGHFYRH